MNELHIRHKYHLGPGHVVVTNSPSEIWMVLGSCVSIVLYDEKSHTIAACHAQLPESKDKVKRCVEDCPDACYNEQPDRNTLKYLESAFNYMLCKLKALGVQTTALRASVLGGSNIMQPVRENSIGEINLRKAYSLLKSRNISISYENCGGDKGRTIIFDNFTGAFTVKMQSAAAETENFALSPLFGSSTAVS